MLKKGEVSKNNLVCYCKVVLKNIGYFYLFDCVKKVI